MRRFLKLVVVAVSGMAVAVVAFDIAGWDRVVAAANIVVAVEK